MAIWGGFNEDGVWSLFFGLGPGIWGPKSKSGGVLIGFRERKGYLPGAWMELDLGNIFYY